MEGVGSSGCSGGQRAEQPDKHSTQGAKGYKNTEKDESHVVSLPPDFSAAQRGLLVLQRFAQQSRVVEAFEELGFCGEPR